MKKIGFRCPDSNERHVRSVSKSVIWRIIGVLVLAAITYGFTRNWFMTTAITIVHHAVFIFVYYAHERLWLRTSWLRYSTLKPFMRVITYEVILGNLILGAISYGFTGELQKMTAITLMYISNKYWMYIAYDYLWSKLRWQSSRRKTLVYAYVAGDLLHRGHLRALKQAKALGDYLIVGVLTDEAIASYKRRPIIPFEERIELFANLKCVDEVVRQNQLDPTENLRRIKPDILVHGDDWTEDFPGAKYMRSIDKTPLLTKYYPGQSTTKIIEKILLMKRPEPVAKKEINDGQS